MIASGNAAPRRYFVDGVGKRVLIGLTVEETREFEGLDRGQVEPRAMDAEAGLAVAEDSEQRWLTLYEKHDLAWRSWLVHAVQF